MKYKYSITTIAIAGVILTQVVPAFAQNLGGQKLIREVTKYENRPTGTAGGASLQEIIKKGDTLIQNRLTSLNKVLTRLQGDKKLSASEASSLTTDVQTDISGLTALKAKIDADTDVTTARADVKSIITNYYVYAMFEPKMRLLITINNLQTISSNVQTLVPQIQKIIDSFKSQGKDVTQLQSLLDDVNTQLQTISTTLSKDSATVQGVTLTTQDKSAAFVQVREDLSSIVKTDFIKIQSDFTQMRPLFKAIISPAKVTPTTGPTGTEPTVTGSESQTTSPSPTQ